MKALIDADILPYEFGSMKDLDSGDLLPWEVTRHMVDNRIKQILEATKADEKVLYLTDSPSNFRINTATILPYKGNREGIGKPEYYKLIQEHLIDNWDAQVISKWEADDEISINQWKRLRTLPDDLACDEVLSATIICSRDKDLNMVPGYHYSWSCGNQEEKLWWQPELEATRCFYKQLLTGDPTDNILGLFGVGKKSKLVLAIDELELEESMFTHCLFEYRRRFGSYAEKFMLENGILLWMLRKPYIEDFEHHFDRLLMETK